jgi:hypothetical protein
MLYLLRDFPRQGSTKSTMWRISLPYVHSSIKRCNSLQCLVCKKKHTPADKDGFPSSVALLKLIKAKSDEVFRNRNVEILKSKLAEVKAKNEEFKVNLENGADKVNEYCISLRNQIHLQTDVLLEQIHQFNENLIAEIDNYEQKCELVQKRVVETREGKLAVNQRNQQFLQSKAEISDRV